MCATLKNVKVIYFCNFDAVAAMSAGAAAMISCHRLSSKPDIVNCGSAAPPTRATTSPVSFDLHVHAQTNGY